MDAIDEASRNAPASIEISLDPDSTVNDESDLQPWRQSVPRSRTEAGIQNDFID
jgi:hypothetical protein